MNDENNYFKNFLQLIDVKKKRTYSDIIIKTFITNIMNLAIVYERNNYKHYKDMFSSDNNVKFSFKSVTKGNGYVDIRLNVSCEVSFVNILQIKLDTFYDTNYLYVSFNNNTQKLIADKLYFNAEVSKSIFNKIIKFLCEDVV